VKTYLGGWERPKSLALSPEGSFIRKCNEAPSKAARYVQHAIKDGTFSLLPVVGDQRRCCGDVVGQLVFLSKELAAEVAK
jgi:hypothetical protein